MPLVLFNQNIRLAAWHRSDETTSPHLTEGSMRLFADHFHRTIPLLLLEFSPACYSGDNEFAL